MYELTITNKASGERNTIFGYNVENAFQCAKLNPDDWTIDTYDFID